MIPSSSDIRRAALRICRLAALVGILMLSAACGSESLPETLPPVELLGGHSSQVEATAAQVFFDVSRNVEGFVPDPDADPAFAGDDYANLVQHVPDLADRMTHRVSLNRFGTTVMSLGWSERRDLQRRSFYRCNSSAPCINGSSELGTALQSIGGADESTLFVAVTPLALTLPSLADLSTDVMEPLVTALRTRRSVGILGLRAQFKGHVYDLAPGAPLRHTGERGLYVIAVGPYRAVREFLEKLAANFPDGRHEMAIFSALPVCRTLSSAELTAGWKPADDIKHSRGLVRLPQSDAAVPPQVRLPRGTVGIETGFDINEQGAVCPHVPLPMLDPTLDESLWIYMNDRWQDYDIPTRSPNGQQIAAMPSDGTNASDIQQEGSRVTVHFLSDWTRLLLPERTFFYHARVRTAGFVKQSRAVGWLQAWTLVGAPVQAPFLRTPLLASLGELLLTASLPREASAPVAEISVVFRTE